MTKARYYINNIEVSAAEFYQNDFTGTELELLFVGVLIRKGENDYRIYMEAKEDMKYDNNFYRGFNKKNPANRQSDKKKKSTGKAGRPYSWNSKGDYYDRDIYDDDDYYGIYRYDYSKFGIDTSKKLYYLAYGSNLNKAQMRSRCPHAVAKYTGLLSGWELFYAGSKSGNYATIRKCEGKSVPVAIWEIDGLDEYYLDIYEGYPDFYFKDKIKFLTTEGEKEAMVYIMRTDAKEGIPSVGYEKTVRQGYQDFGLDEKYLNQSISDTINRVLERVIAEEEAEQEKKAE